MKYFFSPAKKIEKKIPSKALKKNGFDGKIYYMNRPQVRSEIKANCRNGTIKNGDIIEIHAHGMPCVLGRQHESLNDHSPFSLARLFKNLLGAKPDIELTIDLRFCNSSTVASGPNGEVCFARDFSQALSALGLSNISVHGYQAALTGENIFKQSAKGPQGPQGGAVHARLDEVRDIFINGEHTEKAQKSLYENQFKYNHISLRKAPSYFEYFQHKLAFEKEFLFNNIIHTTPSLLAQYESVSCENDIDGMTNQIDPSPLVNNGNTR